MLVLKVVDSMQGASNTLTDVFVPTNTIKCGYLSMATKSHDLLDGCGRNMQAHKTWQGASTNGQPCFV